VCILNCLNSSIEVNSRFKFSKNDVIKLLKEKIISNIFSFRCHRTLKLRSKFILKNLFFIQFKTNWSKIRV